MLRKFGLQPVKPKTWWGRQAVFALVLFWLLFLVMQLLVISGQTGGNSFFDNWYLAGTALAMGLCGLFCFSFGLVAVIKMKDRSPLVWLAFFWGLVTIWFMVGELVGPE